VTQPEKKKKTKREENVHEREPIFLQIVVVVQEDNRYRSLHPVMEAVEWA